MLLICQGAVTCCDHVFILLSVSNTLRTAFYGTSLPSRFVFVCPAALHSFCTSPYTSAWKRWSSRMRLALSAACRHPKRSEEMWRDVENKDERKQTHYELQKRTANSRESQRGNENQTAPPCVFWMPQLWHLVVLKDKMIQNVCLILSVESSSAIIWWKLYEIVIAFLFWMLIAFFCSFLQLLVEVWIHANLHIDQDISRQYV